MRRLRSVRGYSQKGFAQEAGLNSTYVGGVERGHRNVGVVNLQRIAVALYLSLSELFAEMQDNTGECSRRRVGLAGDHLTAVRRQAELLQQAASV